MKILNILTERGIRKTDPEMDDYYDDQEQAEANVAGAPYAVGWSGQYWEWYGDGDPDQGNGRYKPKGDGGDIVAINVPSYEMAQKIANDLEEKLASEDTGERGKSWGYVDRADVYIKSMNDMDEYDRDHLASTMRYEKDKVKDYSNANV